MVYVLGHACITTTSFVALWKGRWYAFQADNPDFMNASGQTDRHSGGEARGRGADGGEREC